MGTIYGVIGHSSDFAAKARMPELGDALAHRICDYQVTWQGEFGVLAEMGRGAPDEALYVDEYKVVVAMDARVDNQTHVAGLLGLDPSTPLRRVVAGAYREWGSGFPARLLGDFAIAIFDCETASLVLVRDHFGVRPLAFSHHAKGLAFASECRPLVKAGLSSAKPDKTRLAEYLLSVPASPERSHFADVQRLPQAHSLVFARNGACEPTQYWRLEYPENEHSGEDAEIVGGFKKVFCEAVRCRITGQKLVGSFLSGGLDSSSVTMVAHSFLAETGQQATMPTFSAVFPDVPETDEEQWIDIVVGGTTGSSLPIAPQKFVADHSSPVDYTTEFAQALGIANYYVNLYYTWELLKRAGELGVTTVLTGVDGDSVISHGVAHLTDLALSGKWDELVDLLEEFAGDYFQGFPAEKQKRMVAKSLVQPALGMLVAERKYVRAASFFINARKRLKLSRREMLVNEILGNVFSGQGGDLRMKALRDANPLLDPRFLTSPLSKEVAKRQQRQPRSERERHMIAVSTKGLSSTFEVIDMLAARSGTEASHPFFDKRVVEYALGVPGRLKISGGRTRAVFREAMRGIVPNAILERRNKANMGIAFSRTVSDASERAEWPDEAVIQTLSDYWSIDDVRSTLRELSSKPTKRAAEHYMYFLAHAAHVADIRELENEQRGH